ncbi:uncharacterized protein I206_104786 [Kwoniella pini CBS 10737]|uniref:BZIP domain-containing protein n=1 Tax=Kwoniella pini CBS 10737 TaxID=1296096 RepID=A0A1B9I7T1_9TREE|nr:uncharacterized protein I206_02325 [Kwoniella pini CBS 10737]OCF51610.1 hypothetical protein I206_02325 [Kwoniella pini CBS 10737]
MSVAISQPRPLPNSSSSLATRPSNNTMLPKQPIQRVQPRPSQSSSNTSNQRPMVARPTGSQVAARPAVISNTSSSSSSRVALPPMSKGISAPSPSSSSTPTSHPVMASRASSTASTPATTPTANSTAPLSVSGKDTSSSAGKIFAKPSKEWVLPERAKPGRKVSIEEPDNKRQSQNRLSQRAHRARRTDYIQTLEERLRQYEANEIHSNVRLQEVARALKNDNERLKNELNSVKMQLMEFNGEKDVWELERRSFKDSITQLLSEVEVLRANGMRKNDTTIVRMEVDQDTIDSLVPGLSPSIARRQSLTHRHSYTRSNSTQQNIALINTAVPLPQRQQQQNERKDLVDCPICPNPDPDCPCQQPSTSPSTSNLNQGIKRDITLLQHQHQSSTCGLCHSTDECLCRVVVDNIRQEELEDVKPIIISSPHISTSSPTKSFKSIDDGCGLCAGGGFCACRAASESSSEKAISIGNSSTSGISPHTTNVVRATSSATALPLRLKSKSSNNLGKQSIWSLNNVSTSTATVVATPSPKMEAVCTGDPDNCDACKNDSFGREFCQELFGETHPDATEGTVGPALEQSVKKGCGNCNGPGGCMSIKSLLSPASTNQASTSTFNGGPSTKIVTPPQPIHGMYDDIPQSLAPLQMACCGNPELCGGHHGTGCTGEIVLGGLEEDNHIGLNLQMDKPMVHLHVDHSQNDEDDRRKLRPDQAWKQLKAHPNAKFASLALLADVVARRTNVLDSMNSPSPSVSPAPSQQQEIHEFSHKRFNKSSESITNHAHAQALVMGKKRGFDIETSAVREALKYLDKATPSASPIPESLEEREGKRRKL